MIELIKTKDVTSFGLQSNRLARLTFVMASGTINSSKIELSGSFSRWNIYKTKVAMIGISINFSDITTLKSLTLTSFIFASFRKIPNTTNCITIAP